MSIQYETFLREQEVELNLYERLALRAHSLLRLDMEYDEFDRELKSAELAVRFRHAISLGLVAFFLSLPLSVTIYAVGQNFITNGIGFLLPLLVLWAVTYLPLYMARLRKLRLIGQAPLGILYLVIAMEVTPNLESSVAFAARNMPDPMGRVFKLLLWLVETRKVPDMEAAFNWYSSQIKEWAPHIAEGLYLVAGSMREVGEMRTRTLEKAVSVVLDGTKKTMEEFARGLDLPVMVTNAFGIMLPVLMLVMLPIASVFASNVNVGPVMLIVYDLVLPAVLAAVIFYILGKRPGSMSEIKYRPTRFRVRIMGSTFNALPWIVTVFFAFAVLQLFLLINDPAALLPTIRGEQVRPSLLTVPAIVALGVPLGLYFMSWSEQNSEIKERVDALEREFASALYQLGNIMSQGVPLEEAMEDVAGRMKGSQTEAFFTTTTSRMKTLGWPVEKVLFDEKVGTMRAFPSNLIRNIMKVILKSAEKGPRSAAMTAISVSRYLKVMQDLKDKIDDMLADAISSIRFQGAVLIPVITGTVVGLGEITSGLLVRISQQVSSIVSAGAISGAGYLNQFLNVEGALQPSYLQLVVGIYVLLSCILLGLFVGGLQEGWDKITIYESIGKVTFAGSLIYVTSASLIAAVFGGLALAVV